MSSSSSSCPACKFLQRKSTKDCVFAPYFPPDNSQKVNNVQKVFGTSYVSKLLSELHPSQRENAVNSLAFEAAYRLRSPVNGCAGLIYLLHRKLRQVQHDLYNAKNELARHIGPSEMLPNMNHPGFMHQHPNIGASSYQVMPYNMQSMMGGLAVLPQGALVIRDSQQQPPPQQQQILEAQQLGLETATRELEMFMNYEQQLHKHQNDLVRFSSGFDTTGGTVTSTGFNQMIPATAAAANMPLALALGSSEGNHCGQHIQQQAVEQSHSHHPQELDLFPYELSTQQQQQLNDLVRFSSGFDTTGGTVTSTGFNQMIPATAATANMPLALALGSSEGNHYGHHIQQKAVEQSHSHHPQQLDLFPYELSTQQQQQLNATLHHQAQQLQTTQPQSASREEGGSFDP